METIDLDLTDGPLRAYVAGSGAPVVLVHGAMLGTALFTWRQAIPALARSFRIHALDLPRHGASRPWHGVVDARRMNAIMLDAMDRLGLSSASLVGSSMGASIALHLALDHPEGVNALVLAAPGGLGTRRPGQLATWLVAGTPAIQRAALRRLARNPAIALRRILHAGRATPGYEALLRLLHDEACAKLRGGEPLLDDRQRLAYGPLRMRHDLLPRVTELRTPTLWVRGADDHVIRDDEIAEAARRSGGELARIADAGHLAAVDQPERFTVLVSRFLAAAPS